MRPDVEEFFCGISFDAYRLLGSHPAGPGRGWLFTLWAPHARRVKQRPTGTLKPSGAIFLSGMK